MPEEKDLRARRWEPDVKVAAAPRDASWFAHPNVYSFKVVHASNGDDFARCMPVPLCESPGWSDLRAVPQNVRCRRRACAKAFAEADAEPNVQEPVRCAHEGGEWPGLDRCADCGQPLGSSGRESDA